jgi:hypothetical protein
MVLYPLNSAPPETSPPSTTSAWEAVARKQKEAATAWWLVAQPDHAALAGDLAASIQSADFPELDAEVVQAITLHDAGWAAFDGGDARGAGGAPLAQARTPHLTHSGRPLSFLDMALGDFLRAWTASIERAVEVAPVGGIMVSEHFSRLAAMRLSMNLDREEDAAKMREFVRGEVERRKTLAKDDPHRESGRSVLVDVLQFCDLLSLYLCCGSKDSVEFPQRFNGRTIRLWRVGEMGQTEPALFGRGLSLGVRARRYPSSGETPSITIPFLLA